MRMVVEDGGYGSWSIRNNNFISVRLTNLSISCVLSTHVNRERTRSAVPLQNWYYYSLPEVRRALFEIMYAINPYMLYRQITEQYQPFINLRSLTAWP